AYASCRPRILDVLRRVRRIVIVDQDHPRDVVTEMARGIDEVARDGCDLEALVWERNANRRHLCAHRFTDDIGGLLEPLTQCSGTHHPRDAVEQRGSALASMGCCLTATRQGGEL